MDTKSDPSQNAGKCDRAASENRYSGGALGTGVLQLLSVRQNNAGIVAVSSVGQDVDSKKKGSLESLLRGLPRGLHLPWTLLRRFRGLVDLARRRHVSKTGAERHTNQPSPALSAKAHRYLRT